MKERIYSGPIKETPETILKDVANSFDGLDLRDGGALSRKIEEKEKQGLSMQVEFLKKMSEKYSELTKAGGK